MDLSNLVQLMERIAPPVLAEPWDNTGLLVAPSQPPLIERVLLTIDLTRKVLSEAIDARCNAIIAYHPPIFSGLQRVTMSSRAGELAITAIEHGIAIYSPHTALDAVAGGVNDWLAQAFDVATSTAIEPRGEKLGRADDVTIGQGRLLELRAPCSLAEAVERIKQHLALPQLRVATANDDLAETAIRTVALCAGAGGSVVTQRRADLYWSGEMRHHDVLGAVERGTHVVLTDHTNTERGFLPILQSQLQTLEPRLSVTISHYDRDPLVIE